MFLVMQAQNTQSLETAAASVTTQRDLNDVFVRAREGAYKITISEEELNAYVARKLAMKQGGALAGVVSLEKILIRLEEERAEVITVRKVFGKTFTTSLWLTIEQTENASGEVATSFDLSGGTMPILHKIKKGGRFGRLTVPQGFLLLTKSAHIQLVDVFAEDIRNGIEEMGRIQIRKGALELDPNLDQSSFFGR